jgi:hypothetical protein
MELGKTGLSIMVPRSIDRAGCRSADAAPSVVNSKAPKAIGYRLPLLLTAWTAAIVWGTAILAIHDARPGPAATAASAANLPSAGSSNLSKLLVFLHPKCPCSTATAGELARLMTRCQNRIDVEVFVFQPADQPQSWSETSLVQCVRTIPGITVRFDPDAKLARQVGASTSGQVLLYDRSGQLQFKGGITGSRGHEGDNDGEDAIVARVLNRDVSAGRISHTPVYGCALYSLESTEDAHK